MMTTVITWKYSSFDWWKAGKRGMKKDDLRDGVEAKEERVEWPWLTKLIMLRSTLPYSSFSIGFIRILIRFCFSAFFPHCWRFGFVPARFERDFYKLPADPSSRSSGMWGPSWICCGKRLSHVLRLFLRRRRRRTAFNFIPNFHHAIVPRHSTF